MTFREFLQIELWSKETTRKILQRVWKIAKPISLIFGVLILLLGVVFAVEWYWMTSGEKTAAKAALVKIEELERVKLNSPDGGFEVVNQQAKSLTRAADQKAWTLRDKRTAGLLEIYRWELEWDHESDVREKRIKALAAERNLKLHSNLELDTKAKNSQAQMYSMMRSSLHKELD